MLRERLKFAVIYLLLGVAVAFATPLFSQENSDQLTTEVPKSAKKKKLGFQHSEQISLGSNLSWYENVVGTQDGRSSIYSLDLAVAAGHNTEQTEWNNTLNIIESQSRTPAIDSYVKSADSLKFESLYLYFFESIDWLGLYGRVGYDAPIFKGYDVRASNTDYTIAKQNGTVEQENTDKLFLTDPFSPALIKEGFGLVMRPYNETHANVEFRLGLGARQYLADGQLVIADNKKTEDVVEVNELEDSEQLGIEAGLFVKGILFTKRVTYNLYSEAFSPLAYSPKHDGDNRGASELISSETGLKVAFSLVEWASLVYNFKNRKDPLLLPKAQTSHNVLVAVTYKNL